MSPDHDLLVLVRRIADPNGWLGNMSRHPIEHEGAVYPTAEHLFQCWRFVGPCRTWPTAARCDAIVADSLEYGCRGYERAVAEIRAMRSPMAAKMHAKRLTDLMVITPRSPADVENMRRVLQLKIAQHATELRPLLDATGERTIVEDCSARPSKSGLFWGAAWQGPDPLLWRGRNQLGKLWMEIRDPSVVRSCDGTCPVHGWDGDGGVAGGVCDDERKA